MTPLERWYVEHGRHDLAWRHTRDRWSVLVAEVMLAQTQVARVASAWPEFLARFPTVEAAAAASVGDLIVAWGRLGYPRRARRLWEAADFVVAHGWPDDLTLLPGVGRYTAGAIRAEVDDEPDAIGIDVNIRRVCERTEGASLRDREAESVALRLARPLYGRDRLLALMDLGALVCTARAPQCDRCPLRRRCATRGERDGEVRSRQPRYEGSFRQRRGRVLDLLRRAERVEIGDVDIEVVQSLVDDGLAEIREGLVTLPGRGPSSAGSSRAGRGLTR